ncbi:energy transducer TonB [Photorhabdus asymbiotica]|uniref:energy transducer TonB n=1 Tax=Photorhabdus asymbiotica TaxID=291112 RepID=UPI003DA70C9B
MNRIRLAFLTSIFLHFLILQLLLCYADGEPANDIALQGETDALTVRMVAIASVVQPTDVPQEASVTSHIELEMPMENDKKPPPLVNNEKGEYSSAARYTRKSRHHQQTAMSENIGTKTVHPKKQVANDSRGKDMQENLEGRMAKTTQQEMAGFGKNEKADYAARLRSEIESHKLYPLRAKRERATGTVSVRFTVEDDGNLTGPVVVSSSGNRDLDEAALKAVRQSRSIGVKPTGFGRSVSVSLRFSLRS